MKKTLKCPRCDRTFGMPGHLARHMNAIHKRKRKKTVKKKAGRGRRGKRVGRPKGPAARMGLGKMTVEQLTQVIAAARAEAQRKIADLERAIG